MWANVFVVGTGYWWWEGEMSGMDELERRREGIWVSTLGSTPGGESIF
jgi:hypothetical protein